jgi:site-specific DNA-methyltransferase (adenine-specific)
MSDPITNRLYYGDNLDILRRYIPDESVDLVYLDPPFNSNRDYNVIFKDESGNKSDAQLVAFEDTWHWGPDAQRQYEYLTNSAINEGRIPESVSTIIGALRHGIGTNQMMAYLVEMAVRLVELQRVLKPTGSLYLHCDPTASHYLKVVLDAIFGPERYLNEITWKRWSAHNDAKRYAAVHDVLLYYGKSRRVTFNKQFLPYEDAYVKERFKFTDETGRRYAEQSLTSPSPRPNLTYPYTASNGVTYDPPDRGWSISREVMEQWDREGRLHFPSKGGRLRRRDYLDERRGLPLTDVWTDIYGIGGSSPERLGYPTQKPGALLERIISASSNPNDVILDPFCGCGTALVAAEKLGRRWIGIDVTYLSIAVMKARLADSFGLTDVPVIGQPTEVSGARALAQGPDDGRYQFQWWALGLVDARPIGGQKKKGADAGIDGAITFTDAGGKLERVLVSVKSGHVNRAHIGELRGTLDREKAAIGVFVTLEEPSKPMLHEATEAGYWHSDVWNRDYQRIQILSIRELLEEGKRPDLPAFKHQPYQKAERVELPNAAEQGALFGND